MSNAARIIIETNQIKSHKDLIERFEVITDIIKDDVMYVLQNKRYSFEDFHVFYSAACEMTFLTLQKVHLKSVKRFYCSSIDESIRWIIRRVISNIRNIAFDSRYRRHISVKKLFHDESTILLPDSIDIEVMIDELHRFDRLIIFQGLRKTWDDAKEDFDFDEIDFQELCEKFGFTVEEVMGDTLLLKAEQTAGGNRQLVLFF